MSVRVVQIAHLAKRSYDISKNLSSSSIIHTFSLNWKVSVCMSMAIKKQIKLELYIVKSL